MQQTVTQQLDTRGLNCPLPILKTRKALSTLQSGDTLELLASDPGSVKDMESFCSQTGHRLMESSQDSNGYRFLVRKA
jgi:tRNA 2-thiouridine synthesizing protein A